MELVDADITTSMNEAFLGFLRAYGSTAGANLSEEPDCLLFTTPIPFPVYNGVAWPRFGENAAERIDELQSKLAENGKPYTWVLLPNSFPSNIGQMLQARNPAFTVELNGMAADMASVAPEPQLPPGVEIRAAQDEDDVVHYANLYARLFGAPTEDWIEPVIAANLELFRSGNDPFHRYIARENGEPIAAGMTMKVGDTAILQTLYTYKEKRGRGIGHAIISRAFADERERGAKKVVIWAGPDADKLYFRVGLKYAGKATVLGFE